jgi:hypothetical protein
MKTRPNSQEISPQFLTALFSTLNVTCLSNENGFEVWASSPTILINSAIRRPVHKQVLGSSSWSKLRHCICPILKRTGCLISPYDTSLYPPVVKILAYGQNMANSNRWQVKYWHFVWNQFRAVAFRRTQRLEAAFQHWKKALRAGPCFVHCLAHEVRNSSFFSCPMGGGQN